MNRLILFGIMTSALLLIAGVCKGSVEATIAWDPSLTDTKGQLLADTPTYKLYIGSSSGVYSQRLDAGYFTSMRVTGLEYNKTYFFAAKACTANGESLHSTELKWTTPAAPTYLLTVNNGSGDGMYTNGTRVAIAAIVPNGMKFVSWNDGNTNVSRTITMPPTPVTYTANLIDIQKPIVKITCPANRSKVMTNDTVVIRGTAADNGVLTGIKYKLYTGEWTNAVTTNGWKTWIANFSPVSGLNTAQVCGVDIQGNVSATSTVVFTYVPGAVLQVQTNGAGTISPAYNGKVLEIGKSYKMTATATSEFIFTNWTYGIGGSVATNKATVNFVMQSNLILTANFNNLSPKVALASADVAVLATPHETIVVDGSAKDWANVPRSSFTYASVTQEVATVLDGNNIALLLTDCPFGTSDTILVYFKLHLIYGNGDTRHTLDLWTSGSVLYGMVDGQVIAGLEAVLLNKVLEVKLPIEQAPQQVTIEEIGGGMDLGGGTLTELFKLTPPPASTQ